MDVHAILDDHVFHSLKATPQEHQDLLKVYFQNARLRGDIGYPHRKTVLELALENQQYNFILVLLQCGEGTRIHLHYFYNLLEKPWGQQGFMSNMQSSIMGNPADVDDVEIIPNILTKLITIHPKFLRSLLWEHIWKQIFKPTNSSVLAQSHNETINIIFKGTYDFDHDVLQPISNVEHYLDDYEHFPDWNYMLIHHGLY